MLRFDVVPDCLCVGDGRAADIAALRSRSDPVIDDEF
jgi:hypothetical protein